MKRTFRTIPQQVHKAAFVNSSAILSGTVCQGSIGDVASQVVTAYDKCRRDRKRRAKLQAKGISKTGLLAWIATCVTNKCRSLFKSEKRRSRREQSWWQEEQDWVQGESTPLTPDEILVRKEAFLARKESSAQLWRIVQETLNELTSDLSGFPAFKHRYIDGLSAQETAEKLQIPVNTVYQQTGRFLGKIRNRIRAKMKAGDPCQEWYETLMLSREDWTEYYADSLRGDPLRSP